MTTMLHPGCDTAGHPRCDISDHATRAPSGRSHHRRTAGSHRHARSGTDDRAEAGQDSRRPRSSGPRPPGVADPTDRVGVSHHSGRPHRGPQVHTLGRVTCGSKGEHHVDFRRGYPQMSTASARGDGLRWSAAGPEGLRSPAGPPGPAVAGWLGTGAVRVVGSVRAPARSRTRPRPRRPGLIGRRQPASPRSSSVGDGEHGREHRRRLRGGRSVRGAGDPR